MILKLKCTPGIYLVGFMACGKTMVGRSLAERLGWGFSDIDAEIEAEQKTTIAGIFDTRGEEAFRDLETEAIRKHVKLIQTGEAMVVALGGGAFTRPHNYEVLEGNGVTIWLDCPLSIIRRRIGASTHRPLARDLTKFEVLYYTRRESYARSDYCVQIVGDDPELTVDAVLKLPIF